jgi:hypothetical protein
MCRPPERFFPPGEPRIVVRIWVLLADREGGESGSCVETDPADDSVLSESLFEARVSR